jgi:hypothetical protein
MPSPYLKGLLLASTGIALFLPTRSLAAVVSFDIGAKTPVSGALTYTVSGTTLTRLNPAGTGTPVMQANANGVCANMSFENQINSLTAAFCGQNRPGTTTLDSIQFKFDKDVILKSYIAGAADFQNPQSGTNPTEVGTGTVTFAPQFTNTADSQVFTSSGITVSATRTAPSAFTSGGGTNNNGTSTENFSAFYIVRANTLVTLSTASFSSLSSEGTYGADNTGIQWRLKNLTVDDVVPTPGPVPLLGAGAAFGWSRRLRNRINKKNQQQSA